MLISSHSNNTSNTSSLGIPPLFAVRARELSDPRGPMNEIAIYMNAVAAMEDLCFTGPRTAHIQSDWSSPNTICRFI